MNKLKKVFGITIVVVLAFMAVGVTAVLAAPAEQGIETAPPQPPIVQDLLKQIFDREAIQEVVADALGISVSELEAAHDEGIGLQQLAEGQGVALEDIKAAVESYKAEAVQDALDDGLITEAQGEWLLNNNGRPNRQQIRRGIVNLLRNIIDPDVMRETVADTLGITVEALEAARDAGTSLVALAAEQEVEIETVHDAMRAAFEDMVEQAVNDGTITQIQADRILAHHGGLGGLFKRAPGIDNSLSSSGF